MAYDVEKYPHGTRVSQFYFPSSSLRCSDPVFFFDIANLKSRSIAHPVFNCSIDLIGAKAFFVLRSSSILRSPDCSSSDLFFVKSFFFCSSSKLFFFKYKNRVLETRFRTRVYKTWDLCGIILPTHQVEIESLTLEF